MNILQVEAAIAVVDYGSFAAAAEVLHLTAKGASQRVHALEKYLGATLFEREGRRYVLTRRGVELEPHLRAFLKLASRMKEAGEGRPPREAGPMLTAGA